MSYPRAIDLRFLGAHRLRIELEHGVVGQLDLSADLRMPPCEVLRDATMFLTARIDEQGVVVWADGSALFPGALYSRLKLQMFVIGTVFNMFGSRLEDEALARTRADEGPRYEHAGAYHGAPPCRLIVCRQEIRMSGS